MIKKAPSYVTSDGLSWLELKDAKVHELELIFTDVGIANKIIENATLLIEVLKSTGRKPRENKVTKVKKLRKPVIKSTEIQPINTYANS